MMKALVVVGVVSTACSHSARHDEASEIQAAREKNQTELVGEISKARDAAMRADAPLEPALTFSEKLFELGREALADEVKRGRLPPTAFDEAWAALERQAGQDASPSAQAKIEEARGYLSAGWRGGKVDKPDESVQHFARCLELDASRYECLIGLRYVEGAAKSPDVERLALEACHQYTLKVAADRWVDVMEGCIDIADKDRARLTWKTAAADLKRYDAEVARAAAEKAAKEDDENRARERRAEERDREAQERLEQSYKVDDSKRLDLCARCRNGSECKSQFSCMWSGENERGGRTLRYCAPASWGQSEVVKKCMH